ncbi:MAG: OB-fold nucleic acid binding domain-containing protein [Candidatus Aenigmatarchaeota archaeon]
MSNMKRLTAKKALIEDLISGDYYTQEGFKSNYLITNRGEKISRASVVGTVMNKFINDDESYGFIVLDDETETIRAKFFQDLSKMEDVEEGQLVEVIGKVREYEGEIYLNTPELIRQLEDPNFLTLRLVELAEKFKKMKETEEKIMEMKKDDPDGFKDRAAEKFGEDMVRIALRSEESRSETEEAESEEEEESAEEYKELKKNVLEMIENLDEGRGAPYQDITEKAEAEEKKIDEVINDLLTEGTCFEPRPGKIKKL